MAAPERPWSDDWIVGLRLWVKRDGQTVLGTGRLELLEGIDRWHSISAAARQMGMSYRRAWLLVQRVNEAAGEPLVEAVTGGSHGGGAKLTPRGRRAVAVFRELQEELYRSAAAHLARLVRGPETETEPVHVAAAATLEGVLDQLLADYALRQPAVRVRTVFGASDELAEHVLAGAPADLFLSADARSMGRLEKAGLVQPGASTILAENRLAAVGPAEQDVPVHRPADFLLPAVLRVALAVPGTPLGGYCQTYLGGLGLYESLRPRVLWVDHARAVVAAVSAGQADAGLAYASDAARATGCRVLFRAPRGAVPIRHYAALVRRARQPEQAKALLEFLTSSHAVSRFRRCGFLPAGRRSSSA